MKNRKKRPYLPYLIAIPIIAAATVSLRTIALLCFYEPEIGRYTAQTLSLISGLLLLAVVGVLAILLHEMREFFVFKPHYRDLPTLFSGVFSAVALILFGVTLSIGSIGTEGIYATVLAVFSGMMAIVGALLFVFRAFDGTAQSGRFALLNLPLAVLGVSYPLYLTMKNGIRIGDPATLMSTVTWIVIAFFFLGESRIALNRALWALHSYVTVLAVIFTATLAFPNLFYHLINGSAVLGNSEQDFAALAIFLYTLSRLIAIFRTAAHEATATGRFAIGMADDTQKTTEEDTKA